MRRGPCTIITVRQESLIQTQLDSDQPDNFLIATLNLIALQDTTLFIGHGFDNPPENFFRISDLVTTTSQASGFSVAFCSECPIVPPWSGPFPPEDSANGVLEPNTLLLLGLGLAGLWFARKGLH
jgi:hypothetical protein